MKKLLKKIIALGLIVACLTSYSTVAFAADTTELLLTVTSEFSGEISTELKALGVVSLEKIFDVDDTVMYLTIIENASEETISKLKEFPDISDVESNQSVFITDDKDTIANEFIISVTPDFSVEITDELKALGVVALEKIFEADRTIMCLAKIENVSESTLSSLQALKNVNYAEANNLIGISENEMGIAVEQPENEIIINTNKDFKGEITDELKTLGIVSLEKIFDADGTVMYLAKIENTSNDMISNLQKISGVNYAEYNQLGSTAENEKNITKSNNNYIGAAIAGVVLISIVGITVVAKKKKSSGV